MIYLQRGDRIPAVGVVQRLLNEAMVREPRLFSLNRLTEDAVYGTETHRTVRAAQTALTLQGRDGIVGPETWGALAPLVRFRIVHVVDRAIEHMVARIGRQRLRERALADYRHDHPRATDSRASRHADRVMAICDREIANMRALHDAYVGLGGNPIQVTDMTRPLQQIRQGLAARSRDRWQVVILRIVAHGGPASQVVALSPFGSFRIDTDLIQRDDDDSESELVNTLALEGMAMPMADFGCVELHGCSIARRLPAGRRGAPVRLSGAAYMQAFASRIGRPATAGIHKQKIHMGTKSYVRFEGGGLVSAYPGGATPAVWFARHI